LTTSPQFHLKHLESNQAAVSTAVQFNPVKNFMAAKRNTRKKKNFTAAKRNTRRPNANVVKMLLATIYIVGPSGREFSTWQRDQFGSKDFGPHNRVSLHLEW